MLRVDALNQFYSDLVLGEVVATDPSYCCDDVNVTWSTGMTAGALVKADGTWAAKADAAAVVGVVVDVRALNLTGDLTNATQYQMAVGKRGLILNKKLLRFSDSAQDPTTDAAQATAIGVLEGNGCKVTSRLVGFRP